MKDLIDGIAVVVVSLAGGALLVIMLLYGVWKPYFKKRKLSRTEFRKVTGLIGMLAFIIGFMMTLIVLIDSQGNWLSTVASFLLCSGIYPVLQTGIFMLHMEREGFVQRTSQNVEKENKVAKR